MEFYELLILKSTNTDLKDVSETKEEEEESLKHGRQFEVKPSPPMAKRLHAEMANRRYKLWRYLENSDVEPFKGGSDEEYQPNDEDEESEDTEINADFIASSAGRNTESLSPTPASSSSSNPSDAQWKTDVLPLEREILIGNHGVQKQLLMISELI
ncbi:unnamed protein product [Arctia plantaginis]|uniref:Uncharacterized protein n=1 Tax=Arctia plantaginis TaxID=874455 RepID=A0A8S1AVA0_ARCPL|nr:unnamed protein product [Arctia plantaginis]CAB3252416.1 unnamed protein product [Arctia plantaginis]